MLQYRITKSPISFKKLLTWIAATVVSNEKSYTDSICYKVRPICLASSTSRVRCFSQTTACYISLKALDTMSYFKLMLYVRYQLAGKQTNNLCQMLLKPVMTGAVRLMAVFICLLGGKNYILLFVS